MDPSSSFRTCSLCHAEFPRRFMRVQKNTRAAVCPSCAGTCACCREPKEELRLSGVFCNSCKSHATEFARSESPLAVGCLSRDDDEHAANALISPITGKPYSIFVHFDPDEREDAGIRGQRVPELAAVHTIRRLHVNGRTRREDNAPD